MILEPAFFFVIVIRFTHFSSFLRNFSFCCIMFYSLYYCILFDSLASPFMTLEYIINHDVNDFMRGSIKYRAPHLSIVSGCAAHRVCTSITDTAMIQVGCTL